MLTPDQRANLIFQCAIIAVAVICFVLIWATESEGHEAPLGWRYPYACCSDKDCRQVSDASVKESASGYTVPSGEVLAFNDRRIKDSPDGRFHWCSMDGLETSRTICLFVPPRAF